MKHKQPLKKEEINNFDLIIDTIINKGLTSSVLAIENLDDIISMLNFNDKKRSVDDPELKQAVYSVIKALLDSGKVELSWQLCWVESARNSPPATQEELFDFIEEYWDKNDGVGLERGYLIWFKKK